MVSFFVVRAWAGGSKYIRVVWQLLLNAGQWLIYMARRAGDGILCLSAARSTDGRLAQS